MGNRRDYTWQIDNEIQPERTLAEVFDNIAQLDIENGNEIERLRRLIPAYVLRTTIDDINNSPPESFDNLLELNSPGKLASKLFGSNLFRRIVGLSRTPEIWTTGTTPTGRPARDALRKQLFTTDAAVTPAMATLEQQLYFIVNQGQEQYTLNDAIRATFGNDIPPEFRRVRSQLRAAHLDTPIIDMPETFRLPEVNNEGQTAIEWFRPKVASFILQNDPPPQWLRSNSGNTNIPDLNYIALDAPEVFLKKPSSHKPVIQVPVVHEQSTQGTPSTTRATWTPVMRRRAHINKKTFRLSSGEVRKLARRGGVKRISARIRDAVNETLKRFVHDVLSKASVYADHANRRTVTVNDIVYALKNLGETIYL
jgi:histone H4